MIRVLFLSAVFLVGCSEVQEATDNLARDGARSAIDQVLVTRFPAIDGDKVTPYTDCVIDNASGSEIGSLAKAALVGVDESTVTLVVEIAQRPDTASCFLKAATKSGF
ncbi:MAG: hypothetical protein ABJL99_25320 [Aliishimia sp.]